MAPSTGRCAHCSKPSTLWCKDCAEALDVNGNRSLTYYCNKDCQKAVRKQHKQFCRNANVRKQLYRGGEILQGAFYAFREAVFDLELLDVKKADGTLHIYEAARNRDSGPLYPFPNQLVNDPKDKEALLAYRACSDGPAHMYHLIKKIFTHMPNITCVLAEGCAFVKERHQSIDRHCWDGSIDRENHPHVFLECSFSNGEDYVVDLAGAQHRQYRTVMPADEYEDSYVALRLPSNPFGYAAKDREEVIEGKRDHDLPKAFDCRAFQIQREVVKSMNLAIDIWEKSTGKKIVETLSEKQAEFEADKQSLLAVVRKIVHDDIKWWEDYLAKSQSQQSMLQSGESAKTEDSKPSGWSSYPQHMQEFLAEFKSNGGNVNTYRGVDESECKHCARILL